MLFGIALFASSYRTGIGDFNRLKRDENQKVIVINSNSVVCGAYSLDAFAHRSSNQFTPKIVCLAHTQPHTIFSHRKICVENRKQSHCVHRHGTVEGEYNS